jgi:hypothetical protein
MDTRGLSKKGAGLCVRNVLCPREVSLRKSSSRNLPFKAFDEDILHGLTRAGEVKLDASAVDYALSVI